MTSTSLSCESTLPAPVLVVEDEPLLQQRLGGVLLGLGYGPDALLFAATLGQARASLVALVGYALCACLFTFWFGGQRMPWLERVL